MKDWKLYSHADWSQNLTPNAEGEWFFRGAVKDWKTACPCGLKSKSDSDAEGEGFLGERRKTGKLHQWVPGAEEKGFLSGNGNSLKRCIPTRSRNKV